MKTSDVKKINSEYSTLDNWKDIYQWDILARKGNTEIISEMLIRDFHKIKWTDQGLRRNNFKINNHKGLCHIQTSIKQFTEKRFCRALYNEFNINPHQLLGNIIDYEVPLTEPNQKIVNGKKISQGDIDLISVRDMNLVFIEAKKANSSESILKALLEIFVYTLRIIKFNRIEQLKKDFNQNEVKKVIPCILTFKDSTSGKQILNIDKYPSFLRLLTLINEELDSYNIGRVEFYLIENPEIKYEDFLYAESVSSNTKEKKILLNETPVISKSIFSDMGNK